MNEESVTLHTDQTFAYLTLNTALNVLTPDALTSIDLHLETLRKELTKNTALKCLIINAKSEKHFSAGADVRTMHQIGKRGFAEYCELGGRVMRAIEDFPLPVLASVHGTCLGGGFELALAADIIVGHGSAKFGFPEVTLGLIPGFGGTARVKHRVGLGYAKLLILSGSIIDGTEAERKGIVDLLVSNQKNPREDTLIATMELGNQIGANAPLAVEEAKRVLNRQVLGDNLRDLRFEVEGFNQIFTTKDCARGIEAFVRKEKPIFQKN